MKTKTQPDETLSHDPASPNELVAPYRSTAAAAGPGHMDVEERTLYRRAVEAAIWGMPLLTFGAMRLAYFRDAGARYHDLVYWSGPDAWTKQTPAPHQTATGLLFANLAGGPLILELPPLHDSVFVSLFDAWNVPLVRGISDEGHGRGPRYVILPPGHDGPVPTGYVPIRSTTHDIGCSIRVIPDTPHTRDLVRAFILLKNVRIRPLLISASTPHSRCIDMAGRIFDGATQQDVSFFTELARMVGEEPPRERDGAMLGLLATLGLRKGRTFEPAPDVDQILEKAIAEARAGLADWRRSAGDRYWPARRWRWRFPTGPAESASAEGERHGDDDPTSALDAASLEPDTLCLSAFEDGHGAPLDGSGTYRLHIPSNVPTRRFWSAQAYDFDTSAFIRETPVVGLSSRDSKVAVNEDGSLELYFAPQRPAADVNWISTAPGRRFYVTFRNYSPDPYVLTHPSRWTMGDVERLGGGPRAARRAEPS